jgi:hypothetical protein
MDEQDPQMAYQTGYSDGWHAAMRAARLTEAVLLMLTKTNSSVIINPM